MFFFKLFNHTCPHWSLTHQFSSQNHHGRGLVVKGGIGVDFGLEVGRGVCSGDGVLGQKFFGKKILQECKISHKIAKSAHKNLHNQEK